jgi:hypothetical protein
VSAKKGTIKNVVWVEVEVSCSKAAPTAITGMAGLYFWKGKDASPSWLKNETPSFKVSANIPVPQLVARKDRKLTLNFTSKTEMEKDFKLSRETALLVYQGRPYASVEEFMVKMTKNGATKAQIKAVLDKNAVLDGP